MPAKFVRPCIPTTAKTVPRGDNWQHEVKFDGYRFQVAKSGRQVRLYSRSGKDWTERMPNLAAAFAPLPCRSALLDGELVFPYEDGVPNFMGCVLPMSVTSCSLPSISCTATAMIFGHCRSQSAGDGLWRLVGRADIPCLHLVETFEDGAALLRAAERHGLEGIVSRRKASAYHSGPSRDWVKVKTAGWRSANRERWQLFEKRRGH